MTLSLCICSFTVFIVILFSLTSPIRYSVPLAKYYNMPESSFYNKKKLKLQGMLSLYTLSNLTYACATPFSHHEIVWYYDISYHKILWYSESNFDLNMKKVLPAHTWLVSTGHNELLAGNWGKFHRIKAHFLTVIQIWFYW